IKRPTSDFMSENPRQFEIAQVCRRFRCVPEAGDSSGSTKLSIVLKPSDPDFVYDIASLKIWLYIPLEYPSEGLPYLVVRNQEIPVGFRVNIERGFSELARKYQGQSVLNVLKMLDNGLEGILSGEKAATVKIVSNTGSGALSPTAHVKASPVQQFGGSTFVPIKNGIKQVAADHHNALHFQIVDSAKGPTDEERARAHSRRSREVRQLEARMKPSPVFSAFADGCTFVLPLDPPNRHLLPVSLQPIKSVRMVVPLNYNMKPAYIEFPGFPNDIQERVGREFERYLTRTPKVTLTAAVNVLRCKLSQWAIEEKETPVSYEAVDGSINTTSEERQNVLPVGKQVANLDEDSKSHIHVIPRPPEWSQLLDNNDYSGGESNSEDLDGDEDSEIEFDDTSGENSGKLNGSSFAEKGTSLTCPGTQMLGISLLEVSSLNLIVKCARCKMEMGIDNLKGTLPDTQVQPRAFRCDQCSDIIGVGFRKQLVHQSSQRLGFFDLTGCTICELLPSDFLPHCAECSSESSQGPELKNVIQGQNVFTHCRICFGKMTLLIPELRLLRISYEINHIDHQVKLKKKTEKEKYVAGTELPSKGRCKHYRKSTRWFRFSCCSKVYACDKCHDAKESHPSEHATRMICGGCSREQNYRPEDCRYCANKFLTKNTAHYWEGGKGTRDQRQVEFTS
ncbi:hypothetical protein EDC01DRAFT_622743, partial [Geopyxis carbonaria]